MSKSLVTINVNSANEMYKKLIQAQALTQLMLDATQEVKACIENELVSNAMWLLSDLLSDTTIELKKREYLKGGQDENQ